MTPEPNTFTGDDLLRCLRLGFALAAGSSLDHPQQVAAVVGAGYPAHAADRLVNPIPILAGRRFLAGGGPAPGLADHYVLVDPHGNERPVRFDECDISRSVEWYLNRADPAEVLQIGVRSCEVVALNAVLTQLGPLATGDAVAGVEIEAPRMSE